MQDNCRHGSLQLVNGTLNTSVSSGRLEICLNRAWGTVCGVQFGYTDAEVACRQLEGFYAEGSIIYINIMYVWSSSNSEILTKSI